jgi:hypothetical protein
MSGALVRVVASTATQSRPKCWHIVTRLREASSSRRQPEKTASGTLAKPAAAASRAW